jgi:hypothetical protein
MKKLFAAILALGLIIAVSGTASAVDVKVSGSYYVAGVYDNNPSLKENSYSRAYFFQRIRLEPVFKIAEGLTFTARMDAMEGAWDTSTAAKSATDPGRSAQSVDTGRNFDWERGYVTFNTGIGKFDVGYMSAGAFGVAFADSTTTRPRIKLTTKVGPMILGGLYEKRTEANKGFDVAAAGAKAATAYNPPAGAVPANTVADGFVNADYDAYYLFGIYPFKGGQTGLLYGYLANNTPRPNFAFSTKAHLFVPYIQATFGPVYVEAEVDLMTGTAKKKEAAGAVDVDMDSMAWYLMARTAMGPATVGAQIAWAKGQDITEPNKAQNAVGGGADWNPALILMSDDLATWSGDDINSSNSSKNNMLLFNIFGDYKVTPKFSMGAAITYAKLDQATVAGQDKALGTEFDVTATYKLYDNLSYMVGAGYLWAGDAFKIGVPTAKVENDYILMNKLTLSF